MSTLYIHNLFKKWGGVVNPPCFIISGRNNSTTISTIKKLCDGLDISIVEFFDTPEFKNLEQEIK